MHSTMRLALVRSVRQLLSFPLLALLLAGCNNNSNPSPTSPSPQPDTVSYTAVGASDAIGIGASHECFPFAACPDGTGYVQLTERRLRSSGKTVTLLNLG